MRLLFTLFFCLFYGLPLWAEPNEVFTQKGYQLKNFELDPSPAQVGDLTCFFEIYDKEGNPLEGLDIEVEIFMPEMGTMPRMGAAYKATSMGQGRYEVELEVGMGGSWELPIRILDQEKQIIVAWPFSFTVGTPGIIYKGRREKSASNSAEAQGPTIYLAEPRRQLIGVELGQATMKPISRKVRTLARIETAESLTFDLQLKYDANLDKLYADREGEYITKGQPLFEVYSEELYTAQDIYLELLRGKRKSRMDKRLLQSAKDKLLLMDLTEEEIHSLEKRNRPPRRWLVKSPVSGYLMRKYQAEGSFAKKGQNIFRITELKKLWALADVFEYESWIVHKNDPVILSLSYRQDIQIRGRVDYVYPYMEEKTRSIKVRILLENPDLALKPGMYADALIESYLGERLVLPRRAVLFSGQHKYVFVSLGDGYFEPREIETGVEDGNLFEVVKGLKAGDWVSFSANFLISSEARLQKALPRWGAPKAKKTEMAEPMQGMEHTPSEAAP